MRRFWPLVLLVIVAGCGKMQRGWSIEKPPLQYASGPTQTGRTTETPNLTPEQANYLCHLAGVWQHEPQGFPVACYNPRTDQVILPAARYWPSADELAQMRAHEFAHARGWRHTDDGTGTSTASLPPVNVFAQQAPAPMTGGNPFAGR